MRFKKYIKENLSEYSIYVDLDGVLADFLDGVVKLTGLKVNKFSQWAKIKKEHWKEIADAGSKFWAALEWKSDGKQLWDYVKKYDVKILSAYPQHPDNKPPAIKGKIIWIKKNLGLGSKDTLLVKGQDKQKYANEKSILIDDSERNIEQWRAKGGIGILHKNTADTIKQLKELG